MAEADRRALPQFYMSCVQVNVTGGGTANPSPTVSIPGAFKSSDPGYTANVSPPTYREITVPCPSIDMVC